MKVLDPAIFPYDYKLSLTVADIKMYWPSLNDEDFEFKSHFNPFYNCLAWAINVNTIFVTMNYFQKKHGLDINNLDHSVNGYAKILEEFYNYLSCENGEYEKGFEKILLYGDNNNLWTHAARQIKEEMWVSKLGSCENIEHKNIECLNGNTYGEPKIFMKKVV